MQRILASLRALRLPFLLLALVLFGSVPAIAADAHAAGHMAHTPPFLVIPFVVLLLMIATGPIFYPHFWHRRYPVIAILLGLLMILTYLLYFHDYHRPIHALAEYFSFIALLGSLYVASGGILIKIDKSGTPIQNAALLLFGSVIANVIGTTGASMLLIRPYIRINRHRVMPYHIVFFIFMISNVGGALTPIGDPPLFLGYLKGVPFFWTIGHVWHIWLLALGILVAMFYFIDRRNYRRWLESRGEAASFSNRITIKGKKNFLWLAVIIGAVFIDPSVFEWVPALEIEGIRVSFVRELIMFGAMYLSYKFADEECLRGNEFDFEPIKEVAYLFIGIFGTMIPALALVGEFAASEAGQRLINEDSLYWGTGLFSSILDNAPTYLTFLAAAMAKVGLDINVASDVVAFAHGHSLYLVAISVAAVFFGAMTYIGNGPNFMVKSIAEQVGIQMPSFFGYIMRYSLPMLMVVLLVTYLLFFF